MTCVEHRCRALVGESIGGQYRLEVLLSAAPRGASYAAKGANGDPFDVTVIFSEHDQQPDSTRRLADLQHPHLELTVEAGHDPAHDLNYLVSRSTPGDTLAKVVATLGPLEPVAAVRIALQACRGIMAAHRVDVIHGGLHPVRLTLVAEEDELLVRVVQFAIGGGPQDPYRAPELSDGASPTALSDVFSLGAIAYHLLTGSAPEPPTQHLQDLAPWVEPGLALTIHRALVADPSARWNSVERLAGALRAFSDGDELLTEKLLSGVTRATRDRKPTRAVLGEALERYLPSAGASTESSLVGHKLGGRYEVLRLIGRGGMGAVYEVVTDDGRHYAAKVVLEGAAAKNKNAVKRFVVEANAKFGVESPHVVRVQELGTDEELGTPFIIMELMHGRDLAQLAHKIGAFQPMTAARLVLQAAYGISAAHRKGIIHRDVKPANLFVVVDDLTGLLNVKICDFGVAKHTQLALYESSYVDLTRTGRMLGSPAYMSPEQARSAKHVDERTDIWSLSVVLWEALSGRRLWGEKPSLGDLVLCICREPIPRLEQVAPWVPAKLAEIVHRGLERNLDKRFESMAHMARALEEFTAGAALKERDLVGVSEARRQTVAPPATAAPKRSVRSASGRAGAHVLRRVAWLLVALVVVLGLALVTLL